MVNVLCIVDSAGSAVEFLVPILTITFSLPPTEFFFQCSLIEFSSYDFYTHMTFFGLYQKSIYFRQ